MHICFLCQEYPPAQHGGVGVFTQTLGRELSARGHQVTVVGLYKSKGRIVDNDQGVRIIRLPASTVPRLELVVNGMRLRRELQRIHDQSPIDVLEGSELSFALLPKAFPACRLLRMHGGHHFYAVTLGKKPRMWRGRLELKSFAHADRLCAVSRFVADTTRELLHLGTSPVEILPNPVNVSLFQPRPDEPEADGLIVFVGAVCEKKGVRQLVQAMPRILQSVPSARLSIIGRDLPDPQTGESFTARLRASMPPKLAERVTFEGAVEHSRLPHILAKAQVCVYPSHMEAQGIVILEGLAMGKGVVASRTGPGPEVVQDEINGLLCDPFDPNSIAEKVIALLRDASLRQRLGAQARVRAVNHFSTGMLVAQNEAFYRNCLRKQNVS